MKLLHIITLLTILSTSTLASDYKKELAEVKSGRRQNARAEWWGFHPEDSTKSLQAALNSRVKQLIISKQTSPWIVNKPLELPSNIEIVFEDGAEIKAKKGCFKGNVDCLIKARDKKNITMRGNGFITMNRKDYKDKSKYKGSSHRHTVGLYTCENITIKGLTIRESGGDAIYLNNIKNTLIDNVVLDTHHRQGISVVGAENILIQNSVIKNTKGTAPQCGIDFEPNHANEPLKNCRVSNCRFENNAHSAVNVSLYLKNDPAMPVDILIENCTVTGGHYGFSTTMTAYAGEPIGTLRGGTLTIKNCTIENTKTAAFYFCGHRTDADQVTIENCTVNNPQNPYSPIYFLVRPPAVGNFGGVNFINCIINAPKAKNLLTYVTLMPQCRLTDVTGNIRFNGKEINLQQYTKKKGYQKQPEMFHANIPLLGFDSATGLKIKRLPLDWYFKIDPNNIGHSQNWQNLTQDQTEKWHTIGTNHWEKSKCSSKTLKAKLNKYDGIGWYSQSITIPASWKNKKVYLYCGAVDESAKFYLNGKLIGERKNNRPNNWMLPFSVRIDQAINWSKPTQQLIIQVKDTRGGGGIWKPIWLISPKN